MGDQRQEERASPPTGRPAAPRNRPQMPTAPSPSSQMPPGANANLRPGMREFLRIRSDSVGSTRGAFAFKGDAGAGAGGNAGHGHGRAARQLIAPDDGGGGQQQQQQPKPAPSFDASPRKKRISGGANANANKPSKPSSKPSSNANVGVAATMDPGGGGGGNKVGGGGKKSISLADAASLALSSLDDDLGMGAPSPIDALGRGGGGVGVGGDGSSVHQPSPLRGEAALSTFTIPDGQPLQQPWEGRQPPPPPLPGTLGAPGPGGIVHPFHNAPAQQRQRQQQLHAYHTGSGPQPPSNVANLHPQQRQQQPPYSRIDSLEYSSANFASGNIGNESSVSENRPSVRGEAFLWSPEASMADSVGQASRGGPNMGPRAPSDLNYGSLGGFDHQNSSRHRQQQNFGYPHPPSGHPHAPTPQQQHRGYQYPDERRDEIQSFSSFAQGDGYDERAYGGRAAAAAKAKARSAAAPAAVREILSAARNLPSWCREGMSGALEFLQHWTSLGFDHVCDTYVCQTLFFDPVNPEFTSLQQFCWAVVLGVVMGVLTAVWGQFIEGCVEVVWKDVPEKLLEAGFFTELGGRFPLPHYMWICPAVFGGILAYITVILPVPIPGQNEWIESLHRQGVLDHETFWYILILSTGGMASGLSLGPELPLVLLSGMVGSYLGKLTQQSVLSARVMNLTAAAAAIGGFFGFPMAGALFVLEIPHRMGLQYFEALSPATISSIFAVIVNRMVTGNDVKGYFNYPFLSSTLPSQIFYIAILYGLIGSFFGVFYAEGCMKLKTVTHDLFHHHEDAGHEHVPPLPSKDDAADALSSEHLPLVAAPAKTKPRAQSTLCSLWGRVSSFGIKNEPIRAAVVGTIAGILTGLVCMFLPHSLFWGEAQLQTLIDKGRTPLPVFGEPDDPDEPTSDLLAYGYCLIDAADERAVQAGFGIGCNALFVVSKVVVIGLSLGTGIVGGHFWGPLYVGAAASNLFCDIMKHVSTKIGVGSILFEHPCVALLCIMGSTHVVTFRAHTAIMLILTLTISAFTPSDVGGGIESTKSVGGDYSAVFPLLVVSCFVSLMITRSTVFYKQQRCRGDIIAAPEVLCEPGKLGQPEYPMHLEADDDEETDYSYQDDADALLDTSWGDHDDGDGISMGSVSEDSLSQDFRHAKTVQSRTIPDVNAGFPALPHEQGSAAVKTVQSSKTAADIEAEFASMQFGQASSDPFSSGQENTNRSSPDQNSPSDVNVGSEKNDHQSSTPPTVANSPTSIESGAPPRNSATNIDDLLAASTIENLENRRKKAQLKKKHRRIQSGSDVISLTGADGRKVGESARSRACSYDRGDVNSVKSGRHSRNNSITTSTSGRDRTNSRDRSNASTPTQAILTKVNSFGEIGEFQPSLMNQARMRASSVVRDPMRNPTPPMVPKTAHRRKSSGSGATFLSAQIAGDVAGAISQEDIERAFSSVQNQANLESDSQLVGKVPLTHR